MIYYVLFAHWLNDFIGQGYLFPSLQMGKNKSHDWSILFLHVLLYTLGTFGMMFPVMGFDQAATFTLINGGSHFVIDAVTSRVSSYAWRKDNVRLFWATIGFDQFLHVAILCATLPACY